MTTVEESVLVEGVDLAGIPRLVYIDAIQLGPYSRPQASPNGKSRVEKELIQILKEVKDG